MRWHYNQIAQASGPLVQDMLIYDSGLVAGQAVAVVAGEFGDHLQDPAAAGLADIAGVLNETASSTSSVKTTGTLVFGKCTMNPDAVFLAEYDTAVANDVDVVSSTSTATTLGTCDDNLEGGWLYCNSGTGVGQLGYIGAASTTVMTLDTTDAWSTTPDSTTDVVLIRPAFALNKDLDSTWVMCANDEDETGELLVLENYIQSSTVAFGPIRPRQHHMLRNLNNDGVKFFSDVFFCDNVFFGATTMA